MITDPAQGYNIKNKKSKNRDIILDKATRKTAPPPKYYPRAALLNSLGQDDITFLYFIVAKTFRDPQNRI
jgi:hypothetical protein